VTSAETIAEWLTEHYNNALLTYAWDDKVQLTNESAVHFIEL